MNKEKIVSYTTVKEMQEDYHWLFVSFLHKNTEFLKLILTPYLEWFEQDYLLAEAYEYILKCINDTYLNRNEVIDFLTHHGEAILEAWVKVNNLEFNEKCFIDYRRSFPLLININSMIDDLEAVEYVCTILLPRWYPSHLVKDYQ